MAYSPLIPWARGPIVRPVDPGHSSPHTGVPSSDIGDVRPRRAVGGSAATAGLGDRLRVWVKRSEGAPELPVPPVTQEQAHTCGPAALLACLAYFFPEAAGTVPEADVMALAGTTDAGTHPDGMVAAAHALGMGAELHEGWTVDDLAGAAARGALSIVAVQAWAPEGTPPEGYADTWDAGHYAVVTSVDGDRVVLEDPMLDGARATLTHDELAERWHHFDGAARAGLAIVVTGPREPVPVTVGLQTPMG